MDIEKLVEDGALIVGAEFPFPPDVEIRIARAVIRLTLEAAAVEADKMAAENDQAKMPKWLTLGCDAPAKKEGAEMFARHLRRSAASIGGNND